MIADGINNTAGMFKISIIIDCHLLTLATPGIGTEIQAVHFKAIRHHVITLPCMLLLLVAITRTVTRRGWLLVSLDATIVLLSRREGLMQGGITRDGQPLTQMLITAECAAGWMMAGLTGSIKALAAGGDQGERLFV